MTATCPCCCRPMEGVAPIRAVLARLSPMQAAIVGALLPAGAIVPVEAVVARVWAADPAGGPEDARLTVHAHLSHARPVLERYGWAVAAQPQRGMQLMPLAARPATARRVA